MKCSCYLALMILIVTAFYFSGCSHDSLGNDPLCREIHEDFRRFSKWQDNPSSVSLDFDFGYKLFLKIQQLPDGQAQQNELSLFMDAVLKMELEDGDRERRLKRLKDFFEMSKTAMNYGVIMRGDFQRLCKVGFRYLQMLHGEIVNSNHNIDSSEERAFNNKMISGYNDCVRIFETRIFHGVAFREIREESRLEYQKSFEKLIGRKAWDGKKPYDEFILSVTKGPVFQKEVLRSCQDDLKVNVEL